jgi:hypothetical protein
VSKRLLQVFMHREVIPNRMLYSIDSLHSVQTTFSPFLTPNSTWNQPAFYLCEALHTQRISTILVFQSSICDKELTSDYTDEKRKKKKKKKLGLEESRLIVIVWCV